MESVPHDVVEARGGSSEVEADGLTGVLRLDTAKVKWHLDEVVRSTVEEKLNQLLDEEADRIAGAGKYERSPARRDTLAGSCRRLIETEAGR